MKKLFTLLTMLILCIGSMWAESKLSKAVAGTYLFDSSNPVLTVNKGGATVTNSDGAIIIHHDDLSKVTGSRTYATVVMRVDMPTTAPSSFSRFISLKPSNANDFTGSIGLGVTTEGKLKGTWEGSEWSGNGGGVVTTSAVTGEHTIVLLCNDGGTTIYVDGTSTSVNNSKLKGGTKWTDLLIESGYVSCVKSVYVLSGDQASNISDFFSELSNVVNVANEETKNVSDNSTATRFFVASGGTLTADVDYDADKIEVVGNVEIVSEKTLTVNAAWFDLTKITGAGNVTLDADVTISGNISTVATGKLTINEGKTLTLGTGQLQTNSIASFTSIDLSGTIVHNNSLATLNDVTVPAGKTGKIFAYDMGDTSDGFNLAGTTTLNGNLTVCNKYNFQMKVDVLAGSGTWLICGTDDDAFNAEETASIEKAIINVAAATKFTGTINLNNVPTDSHPGTNTSQVTVQGDLVGCTLKKTTGDYFYYSGSNLNGTTLDGVILSGTSVITTSNTVNIKNLAGNNISNNSKNYAFVGSGTINFYGICDLTKKTNGTANNYANIGYGSGNYVVFKEGSTVTAGIVYNSSTLSSNAPITVEATATLTTVGSTHSDNRTVLISSTDLTNNGTINLNADGRTSQVSALSGSGTLNVASGSTIKAPSVPSTMTLTGAGDVVLNSFPTSTAPTLTDWTGAVEFPNGSGGDLQAIFNAWGNTNSTIKLNNVTGGYLGNNGTVNPTLNILSGKTLTLNNGFSGSNSTLTKVTGAGTLNRQSWSGSNNHNLIITTLTGFTGTLSGTGHPIIVKKLVLENAPDADDLLIKTSGTVTLNTEAPDGLYVGLQRTSAYTWETKTVEDVEGIYVSALDQVQRNRETAIALVTPYYNGGYVGTGVGKYTISLGETSYSNLVDFRNAVMSWESLEDCVEPTIAINQPTPGYYRIQNKATSRYVNCTKVDGVVTKTSAGITGDDNSKTIFYIDSEKDIQAYDNGAYWKGVYRMGRGTFDDGDYGTLTYKHPWQFVEGNSLGTYKLIYGNETEGKYHATGEGEATGYAELNTDAANADKATWYLIPVSALPARTAAGSADRGNEISLAPAETTVDPSVPNVLVLTSTAGVVKCVNLQLDDDIIAQLGAISFTGTNVTYTRAATSSQWGTVCLPYKPAEVDGVDYYELSGSSDKSLTFTKVAYKDVDKDTPYMFKKTTSGDVSATAEDVAFSLAGLPQSGSEVGDVVKYHLVGIMKNSSVLDGVNETQPKTGYAKIVDANAYYFKNSDNKFYPLKERFNMKAFRCYLTTTNESARQSFLGFAVDDEGSTTGVSFIESEDGKTVDVIFDTTGRRQHQLQKGINIVNGKKIFK